MKSFLGVDGGGSKTRFLLIDGIGNVLGSELAGSAYHVEIGLDALAALLEAGTRAVLRQGGIAPADLTFAFYGLPAHGEDPAVTPVLDRLPGAVLPAGRFRCANDMVCGWAGALAGADGINVIAGTGSIAYGEYAGRSARAGGWGEIFGDEGSAHWIAREGLGLYSRMSDGRAARGPLYEIVRGHFALADDLDLCARINGAAARSELAQLARLVAQAAALGDRAAQDLFARAVHELVGLTDAVRAALAVPAEVALPVSCTGGLFALATLLLEPYKRALGASPRRYAFQRPVLPPHVGAAVHAARLAGDPLAPDRLAALAERFAASE